MKRFWNKVDKAGKGGCWLWISTIHHTGYGVFHLEGKQVRTHRQSLIWAIGNPPKGKDLAIHSCRNRHCVNPDHLRWGSQQDNAWDMMADGTAATGSRNGKYTRPEQTPQGENHCCTVFSDAQVRRIFKAKGTLKKIAGRFGCTDVYVSLVKRRRCRKEATREL